MEKEKRKKAERELTALKEELEVCSKQYGTASCLQMSSGLCLGQSISMLCFNIGMGSTDLLVTYITYTFILLAAKCEYSKCEYSIVVL